MLELTSHVRVAKHSTGVSDFINFAKFINSDLCLKPKSEDGRLSATFLLTFWKINIGLYT